MQECSGRFTTPFLILLSCPKVVVKVYGWLGVVVVQPNSISNYFIQHIGLFAGSKRKKWGCVIWHSVVWTLWGCLIICCSWSWFSSSQKGCYHFSD